MDITNVKEFNHVTEFTCPHCKLHFTLGLAGTIREGYHVHVLYCPICGDDHEFVDAGVLDWRDLDAEPAWMDDVRQHVVNNKKVAAVKEYRAHTGKSLKESKDFVDAMPEWKVGSQRRATVKRNSFAMMYGMNPGKITCTKHDDMMDSFVYGVLDPDPPS